MIKLLNTNNTLYGTNGTIIIDNTGGSNYFARGHMAPDADFIYDVEQVFSKLCPKKIWILKLAVL